VFHLVYHLRRREFAALPRRGDVGESVRIIVAMVRGRPEPPSAKFLAEQRLAYAAIGGVSLVLLLTGMVKSFKNLGPINLDPTLLTVVTLAHTAAAMAFMGLVVAHLAAFLIRANRPLLPSMITGRVSRAYAEHRHPLWSIPAPAVEEDEPVPAPAGVVVDENADQEQPPASEWREVAAGGG
ncbi:MAG: cytochrome b/b6 domain-containing protein, partial [Gemmatimonadota bacterium]